MKRLIKLFICLIIFIVILVIAGHFAIYFTIGDKGKVKKLGINSYIDLYSVIQTCKSDEPTIEDSNKPSDNNKASLVEDIKNASGLSLLSDDIYLTVFATGKAIILPMNSINVSGGEMAYLYTWILTNLASNEEIKNIYATEFDVDFKIEGMKFSKSEEKLNVKAILSISKNDVLKNLDSLEKKIVGRFIKNDRIYATIEYNASIEDNKIQDGENVKISINDRSYKDSKKMVKVIHNLVGNIEEDIITYNNKIINNLGYLSLNDNELIVK